ncbi:hypothetical protein Trydic_g17589 [Trypoxylus dichotomus]
MNNFLPAVISVETTQNREEEERRRKYKEYGDARRRPGKRPFAIGDMVLCRQQKTNALTPHYDPKLFKITKGEGTKITAERLGKLIVRNKSFFKLVAKPSTLTHKPSFTNTSTLRDCAGSSNTEHQMENKITINVENEDEEITDIEEEAKTPSSENAEIVTEENLYGRRPYRQIRPPQRFRNYDMDDTSSD